MQFIEITPVIPFFTAPPEQLTRIHTHSQTDGDHNCCRWQLESQKTTAMATTAAIVYSKIERGGWKVKNQTGEHLFQPGTHSFLMYATAIEPPPAEKQMSSSFPPHTPPPRLLGSLRIKCQHWFHDSISILLYVVVAVKVDHFSK